MGSTEGARVPHSPMRPGELVIAGAFFTTGGIDVPLTLASYVRISWDGQESVASQRCSAGGNHLGRAQGDDGFAPDHADHAGDPRRDRWAGDGRVEQVRELATRYGGEARAVVFHSAPAICGRRF